MLAKLDEAPACDKRHGHRTHARGEGRLAARGYDPVLGAPPLRRTIQRDIEDALSEKILFGGSLPGEIVVVDAEGTGENAVFTFSGAAKKAFPTLSRSPSPRLSNLPKVQRPPAREEVPLRLRKPRRVGVTGPETAL